MMVGVISAFFREIVTTHNLPHSEAYLWTRHDSCQVHVIFKQFNSCLDAGVEFIAKKYALLKQKSYS